MKYLLACVIWNKVNMLDWIADGIVESFNPDEVDLLFIFDNPIDGSDNKINTLLNERLKEFRGYRFNYYFEKYKFPCQNIAMVECVQDFKNKEKYFVTIGNTYKAVICPQDDQKITDKNLIKNIDNIISIYGDRLGVIGLRDGFDFGYQNMISSEWSESEYGQRRLKNGEYSEVKLLNDGGLIYTSELIKKIGYHDVETYQRFYIEDDYCMKANEAGLTNIVLGNDLIHKKENVSLPSTHYDEKKDYAKHDLAAFRKKWKL